MQALVKQWQHPANVIARGQLGHHAAERPVHVDLRVQRVRQQARVALVECNTGFVAGRFDSEDQQGGGRVSAGRGRICSVITRSLWIPRSLRVASA
jgi:hypothetical protein